MQILKTIVDHGLMPVVEFHGQGGEEIQVRLKARSAADDDETLIEVAKVMMLHAAAFDPPIQDRGMRGKDEIKPDWDGPGEKLTRSNNRSLSDALATPNSSKKRKAAPRVTPAPELATADPVVKFLAEKTDLSPNQARDLVDREGRNLRKLRKIARTMKAES
ncbi:hypothetical protein CYK37_18530 [Mesorhizobium loti]|nr:hypothetical protein [Mesorhizobium loti]PLP57613.1 hypothetical protein CYK37_18530 [Mesorhizobium loti]